MRPRRAPSRFTDRFLRERCEDSTVVPPAPFACSELVLIATVEVTLPLPPFPSWCLPRPFDRLDVPRAELERAALQLAHRGTTYASLPSLLRSFRGFCSLQDNAVLSGVFPSGGFAIGSFGFDALPVREGHALLLQGALLCAKVLKTQVQRFEPAFALGR